MATIQIGNVTGAIYQPERPVHLNPDGSAQATLTYKCSSTSAVAVIPSYLSAHPFIPALKCFESDYNMEPGGVVVITTIYKGVMVDTGDLPGLAQHEFSRVCSEAPIETHPSFSIPFESPPVSVADISKIELSLQNNTDMPTGMSAAAEALYGLKRRGVESFMKPGSIYKKSYISTTIPATDDIGYISEPGTPAPAAPTGQNYLCIGISWTKEAGVIRVHEEHQLSGPGGWNPALYTAP